MDAPLNKPDNDRALRALFQEVGPVQAPSGLSQGVLQRIALLPKPAVVVEAPLLPKWVWAVAAVLVVLAVGLTITSSSGTSSWSVPMPRFDLAAILTSKWVLGGMLCAALLFALDLWLDRRRMMVQRIN